VKTDSTRMILDATDPLSDFNVIPAKCINEMGLIVRQNKEPGWLKYSNTVHSFITSTMDLFPGSAIDSISGNFQITAGGYEALRLKEKYIDDPKNLKEALRINEFTMTDTMKVYNSRERQKNLEVSFTARMHLVSNSIGDNQKAEKRIIFQPFCYLSISENPFKQQSRIYPINFSYRFRESYVSTVHLPDGYQVFSKPDDLTIDNQDVKITYQTEAVNENTFRVTASYEFKKEAYDASAYIDLKDYFSTIVDKFNEKLILAKK